MVTNPRKGRLTSRVREAAVPHGAITDAVAGTAREIPAGEFKAKCLAIMDEVQERGSEYVITKRGVPVAKLVPARVERRPFLGSMKGTVTTRGDIVNPLEEPWDALEITGDER